MSATVVIPTGTADRLADMLFPPESPWKDDPVGWTQEGPLRETLWSKQREVMDSVAQHRYTAVRSAHSTGKSFSASRLISWWIESHEPGEAFVVSTAPTATQVSAILWREIGRAHRRGSLTGRITYGQVPEWKIGQELVGYGRKPQDLTSKEEAMAAFSGIHARYVLIVIDEAGGVPRWLFDAVDTLATNRHCRVLAIGNPDDPASHFEKICRPASGWHSIKISAFDTPAYTSEEVPDELLEMLVSREWVEERKRRWGESSPLYVSKVLGDFPDVSDDTLIQPNVMRACQELNLSGREKGQYGWDIARFGTDETCGYRNRGGQIRLVYSAHKQSTMKTAAAINAEVGRHIRGVPSYVDSVGVGGGVVDKLLEEYRLEDVNAFNAGESAYENTKYINRRAEVYWQFREDCEAGIIDLPEDDEDDDLIAQLGAIRWHVDSKGRIGIEKKDDMKKRGLPSPDRADAAVMSAIRGVHVNLPKEWLEGKTDKEIKTLTGDLMKKEM